jgi:hypothetical protein
MTTTNIADQLIELGYDYRDGSWCMDFDMPMTTHWQCDVHENTYSMSATCYRGIGIVGVSAHSPLRVPAAAAMSCLTKQLATLHVAHDRVCAVRIITAQIFALRAEAAAAGDQKQVRICDRALDGRTRAIAQCAAVIAAGQG